MECFIKTYHCFMNINYNNIARADQLQHKSCMIRRGSCNHDRIDILCMSMHVRTRDQTHANISFVFVCKSARVVWKTIPHDPEQ